MNSYILFALLKNNSADKAILSLLKILLKPLNTHRKKMEKDSVVMYNQIIKPLIWNAFWQKIGYLLPNSERNLYKIVI